MRYNKAGTSYKASAAAAGDSSGCPASGCHGYELMQDLDFDVDGDGITWRRLGTGLGNGNGGYTLDAGDRADYFPVGATGGGGWFPIGNRSNPFAAVFEGNGHSIRNLAIRRNQTFIGLFGAIGGGAAIRNLSLIDNLADNIGFSSSVAYIGGLVGLQKGGSITASSATGAASGGGGSHDSVGGLVGLQEGGSITASSASAAASGGGGSHDSVGGLVGLQEGGSITASSASAAANGGHGISDEVGGLVGLQEGGSITASYATGVVEGGGGYSDEVGGLVGLQEGGVITASYATGTADGGNGAYDRVGGLVGSQSGGVITASYATGAADGGRGGIDRVGGLVGHQYRGSITASYGFGEADGELKQEGVSDGSARPLGVSRAAQLTAGNAGSFWNDVDSDSWGAWDFGGGGQIPALKYADYDGTAAAFDCAQFPLDACGTFLPGQKSMDIGGPPAARGQPQPGAPIRLTALLRNLIIKSWSWRQLAGVPVTLRDADTGISVFTMPVTRVPLEFELTATASGGEQYSANIIIAATTTAADVDGNGLIEINSLAELHNMRYDLAGASYKSSAGSVGASSGCPDSGCRGYELMQDLDFDVNGDGRTWRGDGDGGYTLDPEDNADYFPVGEDGTGGWLPIGDDNNPFIATFDGNGHSIRNLAIRRNQEYIGLFGRTGREAAIRNLGLIDNLADYSGSSIYYIGGLVGRQVDGSITASYATGVAQGGNGRRGGPVGGLVGWQESGSITASYATGVVEGGDGAGDYVGGLVGRQDGGVITASYATGAADGGAGAGDQGCRRAGGPAG